MHNIKAYLAPEKKCKIAFTFDEMYMFFTPL